MLGADWHWRQTGLEKEQWEDLGGNRDKKDKVGMLDSVFSYVFEGHYSWVGRNRPFVNFQGSIYQDR